MAKRTKALRIATVGDLDPTIAPRFESLPGKLRSRDFGDLYGEFADLVSFRPHVVILPGRALRVDDAGALRLLRRQGPKRMRLVLTSTESDEGEVTALARRINAHVLATPCTTIGLSAALDASPGQVEPSIFLDVARGLADEIGNPLMFAAGHSQLLEATSDPADRALRDQVTAIRQGLDRIASTLEKVKALARVHACKPPLAAVPLAQLFEDVLANVEIPDSLQIRVDRDARQLVLRGDRELLARALRGLVEVAAELHTAGADVRVASDAIGTDLRIRVRVRGENVEGFDARRSFEPYHLNRALRGTTHGLTLFLVQSIVHAHGGRAFARRSRSGGTRLELQLSGAV